MNKFNNQNGIPQDRALPAETVNKTTKANKRNPSRIPVMYNIPVAGIVIVENVLPGSRLINNGTSIIRYNAINESGIKVGSAIIVEPGNSAEILIDYNVISVENSSVKTEGNFYLRVK
jgi:hypothetical protein